MRCADLVQLQGAADGEGTTCHVDTFTRSGKLVSFEDPLNFHRSGSRLFLGDALLHSSVPSTPAPSTGRSRSALRVPSILTARAFVLSVASKVQLRGYCSDSHPSQTCRQFHSCPVSIGKGSLCQRFSQMSLVFASNLTVRDLSFLGQTTFASKYKAHATHFDVTSHRASAFLVSRWSCAMVSTGSRSAIDRMFVFVEPSRFLIPVTEGTMLASRHHCASLWLADPNTHICGQFANEARPTGMYCRACKLEFLFLYLPVSDPFLVISNLFIHSRPVLQAHRPAEFSPVSFSSSLRLEWSACFPA